MLPAIAGLLLLAGCHRAAPLATPDPPVSPVPTAPAGDPCVPRPVEGTACMAGFCVVGSNLYLECDPLTHAWVLVREEGGLDE